jgi:hypothetical protein
MNLQTIKSVDGQVEYVLLPITAYNSLSQEVIKQLESFQDHEDYELFNPADYVDNPVALARIEAGITQKELAYVSKIEAQSKPSLKTIKKIELAIGKGSQK